DSAMTPVASTMTIADATARRRSRSTSTGKNETPITSVGSATSAASQSQALLIAIAFGGTWNSRHQNGIAQPLVEAAEHGCESSKGHRHCPVEDVVQKSTLECDQEQLPACPFRFHHSKVAIRRGMAADGSFKSVQVVEDVRRAQELQQPK